MERSEIRGGIDASRKSRITLRSIRAPTGAPPPLFFEAKEFVALVGKPRARMRRENESARAIRPRFAGADKISPRRSLAKFPRCARRVLAPGGPTPSA